MKAQNITVKYPKGKNDEKIQSLQLITFFIKSEERSGKM